MTNQSHELTLNISSEMLKRLEAEAKRQNLVLTDLVHEALKQYLEEEIEDTPDEEIIADLREGLLDVRAGRVRPARQMLEEIRRELKGDA